MDTISRVRNDKARRYLTSMRKKEAACFFCSEISKC
ncbi:hypothetical protein RDI58_018257 [Solanum bulbocastanum]|uniref:Uncharacterized protein n=1 Tax=Solanum bulbocastanum TaxID=147425 RepID=A0AAN8TGK6_SOLBU